MKTKKLTIQIDEKVLKDLKSYVNKTNRDTSSVVTQAITEYLQQSTFHGAMDKVIKDNIDLFKRLVQK